MATPRCDTCGENPSQVMLTQLGTGDTVALCFPCLVEFVASLTTALSEQMEATEAGEAAVPPQQGEATSEAQTGRGSPASSTRGTAAARAQDAARRREAEAEIDAEMAED